MHVLLYPVGFFVVGFFFGGGGGRFGVFLLGFFFSPIISSCRHFLQSLVVLRKCNLVKGHLHKRENGRLISVVGGRMIMRQKEFMSVPKQYKVYRLKKKKTFIPEQCLCRNTESYTSSSCCSIIIILPQFCQLISSRGQTLNFLLARSHQEFLYQITFTNSWPLLKNMLLFKTSIVGRAVSLSWTLQCL